MPIHFSFLIILNIFFYLIVSSADAAPGEIRGVRILSDGWRAEIDIEGFKPGGNYSFGFASNNTPLDPQVVLEVVSQGYDSAGNLGTVKRTLYGTHWIRRPFPNQTQRAEFENSGILTLTIALSDFVYADDKSAGAGSSGINPKINISAGFYTNSGAGGNGAKNSGTQNLMVSNNSLLQYPKIIGRWAWPGYDRASADFLLESVLFHRFARNGNPIAAVSYSAQDQSGHTVSTFSTDMRVSGRASHPNAVLVYAASLSTAGLNANERIEVNFKAYPWIGDETSILDSRLDKDGTIQPDAKLGPLYFINDKNSNYGAGYAVVSKNGNDSSGKVFADPFEAENSGFAFSSIAAAAKAIKSFHNSRFGRNDAGGGVIALRSGNHVFPGSASEDLGMMDSWLTIKPSPDANRDNTFINAGSGTPLMANKLKIEGVSLVSTDANLIIGRSASDAIWLDNNFIDLASSSAISRFKVAYATRNNLLTHRSPAGWRFASTNSSTPFALIRANNASEWIGGNVYNTIGNKNISPHNFTDIASALVPLSDNSIYAFNSVFDIKGQNGMQIAPTAEIKHGVAIVQNLFESTSTTNEPLMYTSGGGGVGGPTNHILFWHNSFVGGRTGFAYTYNTIGDTPVVKHNWSKKFNIFREYGVKTDTFPDTSTVGDKTGNWSILYSTGSYGNFIQQNSFPAEFAGIRTVVHPASAVVLDALYLDDRSTETSATGNGQYSLKVGSPAIDLGSFDSSLFKVLPFDLSGSPRTGNIDAGALEFQSVTSANIPARPSNLRSVP